jgi:hypothetical protein
MSSFFKTFLATDISALSAAIYTAKFSADKQTHYRWIKV